MSKPKNDNRQTTSAAQNDNQRRGPRRVRIGGIDIEPARAALRDLVTWAFDLAAHNVADWPEARRRVRSARRFVLAVLRDRAVRDVPVEDVLFTAHLLARIFEADLGFDPSEMVTILGRLGLPTDVVPIVPRPQPSARLVCRPPGVPLSIGGAHHAHPMQPAGVRVVRVAPPCDRCGQPPRFRNAA